MKRIIALLAVASVVVLVSPRSLAADAHYPTNRAPLQPTMFTALPLGSVHARGWLLRQLELQRNGLTGHAEQVLAELDETSAWRGGNKDNWERSPYYVKGLVALAYTLDDPALKDRAQKWIDWCLSSQRSDGFYGPASNDDWWPRMVSNYFLRDYQEATGDPRVVPFLLKYYRYMLTTLPARPLREWGKSRAGDEMDTAIWVYNRTGETFLLELVDLLRRQAYDWPGIMRENLFQSFGRDFQPKHNVNVPQAMKMPVVAWLRTGDALDRAAIDAGHAHLMHEHGLTLGMESGTEFLGGRSPGQGVEFCSIVEQMLSDETIVRVFGEGKYADQLEEIAYNALPAAWNRDLTALRYYTLPNHVMARRGGQGFGQNYDDGIVYGPRSGYPCCCFNVHQGWPKFVQNTWAATSDGGLAVIAYAPNVATATVGKGKGATATITQETNYPFADAIHFSIKMSAPARFPLKVRTPGWCTKAGIAVNGQAVDAAKPGEFAEIRREWKSGDVVEVRLPMSVRIERGVHDSASVHRGPLIYSLLIPHDDHVVAELKPGFKVTEETPTAAWNYALQIGAAQSAEDIEVESNFAKLAADENPFDPKHTPVRLHAKARKLPQWQLAWNGVVAADPPSSPVQSVEPVETITLLPFGALELRLTDFPVLGERARADNNALAFTFDDNTTTGWSWYGGGWWAHDGKLQLTPGSTPGSKALVENFACQNLRMEAEVTPPPKGDAGVVFRVSKPSIGADAYEGYYAGVSSSDNQIILGRASGKAWTPLKIVAHAIAPGRGTTLRVTAVGERIEVRVNDEKAPAISLTDATYVAGQAGVRVYTTDSDHMTAAFDNVRITPLPAAAPKR